MTPKLAPIVIFIHRRPNHLRNTLEYLKKCEGYCESPVIVYGDGPRNETENKNVLKAQEVAMEMLGDKAEYFFSENNIGLSKSVITGVTKVLKRYGKVIVLEDDLEVNPRFLKFMNEGLISYAESPSVYQISGYQFGSPNFIEKNTALFLPITVSWGWATWQRAWEDFDPDAIGWEKIMSDKSLCNSFNLDGSYNYSTLLVHQMKGLKDSWAIRWYWSVFKNNGVVVFPPRTLVKNTGFDGSGTHGSGLTRKKERKSLNQGDSDFHYPLTVKIINDNYTLVKYSIRSLNGNWQGLIINKLRWLYTKLWMYYK